MNSRKFSVALGVFLVSLSVLVYEIALTRIFSIILTYHYVFLVLSAALLGLSCGGVFEFFWHRRGVRLQQPDAPLSLWGTFGALAMSASAALVALPGIADTLLLLVLVALPPFFFTGILFASVFRRFAEWSASVYAADLVGAALGAVVVVWALNTVGGQNSVLAASVVAAAGSLLLAFAPLETFRWVGGSVVALVLTGILFALNLNIPVIGRVPVGRDLNKDLYRILNNPSVDAEIIETRWSAFGRTDLMRQEGHPDMMDLFVDGAAGTAMYRWSGSLTDSTGMIRMLKRNFTGAFPLKLMDEDQKDNALVIGPGGGRDVLVGLFSGVKDITAVEVNPDFVALVQKYSDYNGGIYTHLKNVRIVVDEGRNFLKRSNDLYDIIMLTLPITKSSRSYEGYALTENFLFTRESFRDYLHHLTPEGSLVIVNHGLLESFKLLTTALAAFEDRGKPASEAMKQIYVLGHMMMPVFVVQNTALDSAQADRIHTDLHMAGFEGHGSYVPYAEQQVVKVPLYEGMEAEWRMMNQNMIDLAAGKTSLDELIQTAPFNLEPATDDRPFFFNLEPGIPGVLSGLFWLSALFLAALIGIPALKRSHSVQVNGTPTPWQLPFLFTGIGMGFMLIEITLFQKLVLYLGQPVFALALLLSSLLVGAGLGSFVSGRIGNRKLANAIRTSAVLIAVAVLFTSGLLGSVFERLIEVSSLPLIASAILLIGLGFVMGLPFPLGIRLMKQGGLENDIPWMWGINGAASVFGSVLAMVVAVSVGYGSALILGAFIYLSVAIVPGRSRYGLLHTAME